MTLGELIAYLEQIDPATIAPIRARYTHHRRSDAGQCA